MYQIAGGYNIEFKLYEIKKEKYRKEKFKIR